MSYDKNEVKAGAVILVAIVLLVALVFAVGDFGRFFSGHYYVDAVFDSVQGLPGHAPVIQRGLEIGSVEDQHSTTIEGKRAVVVRMRIVDRVVIIPQSVAKITQVGFLNRPFVAIIDPVTEQAVKPLAKISDPVSDQIPRIRGDSLADFTEIAVKTQTLMDEVMKNTLPKVNDTIQAVKDLVSSEDFQQTSRATIRDFHAAGEKFADIAGKVDDLVGKASPKVDDTLTNVRQASADAATLVKKSSAAVDQVSGTIRDARPEVKRTLAAVRQEAENLSTRIDAVQSRLQKLLADTDDTVLHVSEVVDDTTAIMRAGRTVLEENRQQLHLMLVNLEATSAHLESLIRQLDDSPSRLIFDRSVRNRNVPQTVEISPASPEESK